jgi:hypothetical protein
MYSSQHAWARAQWAFELNNSIRDTQSAPAATNTAHSSQHSQGRKPVIVLLVLWQVLHSYSTLTFTLVQSNAAAFSNNTLQACRPAGTAGLDPAYQPLPAGQHAPAVYLQVRTVSGCLSAAATQRCLHRAARDSSTSAETASTWMLQYNDNSRVNSTSYQATCNRALQTGRPSASWLLQPPKCQVFIDVQACPLAQQENLQCDGEKECSSQCRQCRLRGS